ncbi:MAG: NACHT domain-containing protein [bacterium]|nr:NACHT domain-containing protein [bacterium]
MRGRSLRELLDDSAAGPGPRWVVRGDPGCGKTTLVRHLAWELAGDPEQRWYPVYLRVRQLVEAGGGRGQPWARVRRLLEEFGHDDIVLTDLEALRAEGRLLVILDGLDEVGRERAEAARSLITLLATEHMGPSPILVTCRRIGYRPLGHGFGEADVLPLGEDAQALLLRQCLNVLGRGGGGKSPETWVREFASEATLASFAENPLLLTLMAILVGEGKRPAALRSQLYEQVIDLLLDGRHKPDPQPVPCKLEVHDALACVAERMTEEGQVAAKREVLETYVRRMRRLGETEQESLENLLAEPCWHGDSVPLGPRERGPIEERLRVRSARRRRDRSHAPRLAEVPSMKRVGGLWDAVVSFENLRLAALRAARGKHRVAGVARFLADLELEVLALQRELRSGTWRPGRPTTFRIHDPKERTITAAPFRERVVHHALMDVLEPVLERRMVHVSFACRRGKGTHAALAHARQLVRRHGWFLELDIARCFDSLDHGVVLRCLRRAVKDRAVLELADTIVTTGRGVGLPIGSLCAPRIASTTTPATATTTSASALAKASHRPIVAVTSITTDHAQRT